MQLLAIATAATGALVVALLVCEAREATIGRWVTKPLASIGFILCALLAGAPQTSRYSLCILIALVLSFFGDVFLIPKSKASFKVGLFAFLIGHFAFAAAFVARGLNAIAAAIALAALVIPAVVVGRWLWPRVDGKLRGPVLAYIAVITGMVACAIGSVYSRFEPLPIVAAAAFYLSDLSVARDTFVHKSFVNRLWGLPLYYGAQLLFAWSVR